MKRILIAVGLAVSLGTVFGTVPAGAGPGGNEVSATLSCDRGVTSSVSVTIYLDDGRYGELAPSCGPDTSKNVRGVLTASAQAVSFVVTRWTVSTDSEGCASPMQQPVPQRLDCGGRIGAKLTVR